MTEQSLLQASAPTTARTFPRTGAIRVHETWVQAWEETVDDRGMRLVLRSVIERLRFRGFRVVRDPEVAERYPRLSPDRWLARLGDLQAEVERTGRILKVEFFQDVVNIDNVNGGRYCFGKFERMPRTMQLRCVVEVAAIVRKLQELGYTPEQVHGSPPLPEAFTLLDVKHTMVGRYPLGSLEGFNARWNSEYERKTGTHRFDRDETGWPSEKEISRGWSGGDRDGTPVRNGDVVYLRLDGRLARGVARPNMGGMWFVGDFAVASECRLFRCERPDLEPRRLPNPKRTREEIEKALKANNYRRVEKIARAMQKLADGGGRV